MAAVCGKAVEGLKSGSTCAMVGSERMHISCVSLKVSTALTTELFAVPQAINVAFRMGAEEVAIIKDFLHNRKLLKQTKL